MWYNNDILCMCVGGGTVLSVVGLVPRPVPRPVLAEGGTKIGASSHHRVWDKRGRWESYGGGSSSRSGDGRPRPRSARPSRRRRPAAVRLRRWDTRQSCWCPGGTEYWAWWGAAGSSAWGLQQIYFVKGSSSLGLQKRKRISALGPHKYFLLTGSLQLTSSWAIMIHHLCESDLSLIVLSLNTPKLPDTDSLLTFLSLTHISLSWVSFTTHLTEPN